MYLARARVGDPADVEIRLIQARVLAWDQQYNAALLRYDSVLATHPGLRDASLGRAQTLAWAGKLEQSRSLYEQILARDSTDVEAMLGRARVSAWSGDLASAEEAYHQLLTRDSRDLEARVDWDTCTSGRAERPRPSARRATFWPSTRTTRRPGAVSGCSGGLAAVGGCLGELEQRLG